jgi:hypothetical protein
LDHVVERVKPCPDNPCPIDMQGLAIRPTTQAYWTPDRKLAWNESPEPIRLHVHRFHALGHPEMWPPHYHIFPEHEAFLLTTYQDHYEPKKRAVVCGPCGGPLPEHPVTFYYPHNDNIWHFCSRACRDKIANGLSIKPPKRPKERQGIQLEPRSPWMVVTLIPLMGDQCQNCRCAMVLHGNGLGSGSGPCKNPKCPGSGMSNDGFIMGIDANTPDQLGKVCKNYDYQRYTWAFTDLCVCTHSAGVHAATTGQCHPCNIECTKFRPNPKLVKAPKGYPRLKKDPNGPKYFNKYTDTDCLNCGRAVHLGRNSMHCPTGYQSLGGCNAAPKGHPAWVPYNVVCKACNKSRGLHKSKGSGSSYACYCSDNVASKQFTP